MNNGFREPIWHDRAETELKEQAFRDTIGHEHQVGEALQARRASGYKVRWRIAWGQVIGWLIVVAVVGGVLLLALQHAAGGQ